MDVIREAPWFYCGRPSAEALIVGGSCGCCEGLSGGVHCPPAKQNTILERDKSIIHFVNIFLSWNRIKKVINVFRRDSRISISPVSFRIREE